jgi:hypothetical protein
VQKLIPQGSFREIMLASIPVPGQVVTAAMATFRIELDELDLGQLLDGLEMRAESWERTAEYLRSGYIEDGFIVEECSKPEEADGIAAHYRSVVRKIREQMEAQR